MSYGLPQLLPQQPQAALDPMAQMGVLPQQMMPQQSPQILAGPSNPSPHGPIGDVLNQMYVNNQQQSQQPNFAQQILAMRFQPTQQDDIAANRQNNLSLLAPNSFKGTTANEQAKQRVGMELAPYTTSLDLQGQQADVQLKQAQASMYNAFGGTGAGTSSGGPQLSGEQYLATLPPQTANYIKSVAEGRMPMPSGMMLKTPFGQNMLMAMSKYDPNFDAINYAARAATRKDFTSGKSADNITSLNTAMSHLGSLKRDYDTLGNGPLPDVNAAVNWAGNTFGNSRIQSGTAAVGTDAEAVAHELAKVFRATGMSEGEVNAWKEKIKDSASKAQSDTVIKGALDLMDGRLQALGERYNQGMGTTKDVLQLLSPEAQQAYLSLKGSTGQVTGAVSNSNVPTFNSPNDPGFAELPSGSQFMYNGKIKVKH